MNKKEFKIYTIVILIIDVIPYFFIKHPESISFKNGVDLYKVYRNYFYFTMILSLIGSLSTEFNYKFMKLGAIIFTLISISFWIYFFSIINFNL